MNYFTFDGIDSRTYNTYIATSNAFDAPGREDEIIKVPGSNNIYYLTEGTYKPFDIKLYCYIPSNMQVKTDDLRNFLLSKGTCRYTEAIRPNEFRVARFIEAYELDVSDRVSAAFVLTFKAQPQRYLISNDPITTTATADTTTDTTMSLNTVPTPINISLNGNTTQEGTPSPTNPQVIHNVSGDNKVVIASKNLLSNDWDNDWQRGYWDISTGEFVSSRNWQAIKYYIPVKPNTTYYVYADPNISASIGNICQYDANKNFVIYKAGTKNTTFTTSANVYFLTLYVGNVYKGTNISLTESDTTTNGTYVPFTNQSYPLYLPVENLNKIADVKSGWLPATGAYPTTNGSYPNAQYLIVPLNKGETCYLSGTTNIKGRVRAMNTSTVIGTVTANTTYYTTTADQSSGFKEGSITALQDLLLGILFMDGYASSGGNELIIAKGTNVQNYSIELNKIGTYQDYIYKNGGKWYVHKETYRLDLLSTYGYSMRTSGDIKYFTLSFGSTLPRSVNTFSGAFCNRFINGSTVTLGTFYITGTGSIFLCVPTDQTLASQLEFREWLSSNPTYAIIPLATATNTEITDTTLINQLNNIEKAYSYNGTTNILQVSNDNGFMLEVVSLHSNNVSSSYKGEPIITVNSTGLIYFNGCVIKVNQAPMTINSQTMQAYNGTVNLNNYIEANDFPMIEAGNNVIGSEMPLSIVPNYWKL